MFSVTLNNAEQNWLFANLPETAWIGKANVMGSIIKESLVQKVRAFGAFLAAAIPIAISIIQLISKGG